MKGRAWSRVWMSRLALALGLTIVPTLLLSCQVQPADNQELDPAATSTPRPKPTPLTGDLTMDALETYAGWEGVRTTAYTPDAAALEVIRSQAQDLQVLIFLGTWCPDSVREVPRFLQIMQQAGIPEERLTLIGLDYTKVDTEGRTEQWGVEYVPTIILLDQQGQELGRIVEKPSETETLEGDISAMLTRASAS